MADIIQLRRDTAANWTSTNPTLAMGEIGYETDTSYFKVGDGTTVWTGLSYWSALDGNAIHDNVGNEISAITEKTTPVDADVLVIEDSESSYIKKRVQLSNMLGGGVTVAASFPGSPDDGDLVYLTTDEALYLWDNTATAWIHVGGGGGEEESTMSSEGTGISVYWQKDGMNFELNAIKSENNLLSVALDGVSHDVELTVNEGNFSLANLGTRTHASLSDAPTDAHHTKTGDDEVKGLILSDVVASRPAFGTVDRFFWATDEHILYRDTGTAWVKAATVDYADLDGIPSSFTPAAHVLATSGPHTGTLPLADLAVGTQGGMIRRGATDWEELAKGTQNYVLKAGATDISWGQVDWGELSGSQPAPIAHAMDSATYHTRTDITTLDASTSFHGFLKKLDNNASNFMNGQGNWAAPAGGASLEHLIFELWEPDNEVNVDVVQIYDSTQREIVLDINATAGTASVDIMCQFMVPAGFSSFPNSSDDIVIRAIQDAGADNDATITINFYDNAGTDSDDDSVNATDLTAAWATYDCAINAGTFVKGDKVIVKITIVLPDADDAVRINIPIVNMV